MMRKHKRLGHFSQQVVENFHKLVRWFYARTNREGGNEGHIVESSMNIMQLFYAQKILEMEAQPGDYNQGMIDALKQGGATPLCNCNAGDGRACGWLAHSREDGGASRKRARDE